MNSIIESLWEYICTTEPNKASSHPQYLYYFNLAQECRNQLFKTLGEEEQCLLRKCDTIYCDMMDISERNAFITGFSSGIQLMSELQIHIKDKSKTSQ